MFIILGILLTGIAFGYICRYVLKFRFNLDKLLTFIVWMMLLAFGASLGSNSEVMADFYILGLQGLLFGTTAFLCSALACMFLQRVALRNRADSSNHIESREDTKSRSLKNILRSMAGSSTTVAFFVIGIVFSLTGILPTAIKYGAISEILLYVLIVTVGIGIGNRLVDNSLRTALRPRIFLIAPVSIIGTLSAGVFVGILPIGFGVADSIAGVSGMGYYSLSSLMIAQLKAQTMGAAAMQLGAAALLGNIIRELLTLLFAPLVAQRMGTYALIGGAGVTSMDVCLPAICSNCGQSAASPALVNGLTLEILCPFLITAACYL